MASSVRKRLKFTPTGGPLAPAAAEATPGLQARMLGFLMRGGLVLDAITYGAIFIAFSIAVACALLA